MAEETTKKTPAEEKDTGGFGDILAGIGKGLVDGLAESVPIAGKMIQYGVNAAGIETPDYADKTAKRAKAKQELIAATNRNKEYEANASLRDKQRKAEEMKADEFAARALDRDTAADRKRMEDEEYIRNAPVREAHDAASMARANLASEQADFQFKTVRCSALRDGLKKDLSQNPAFATMSFAEQDDFCNSPRVQTMIDAKFYLREIQAIGQKDQGAFGRMDRALRRQGWSLVDGKDGIKYLDMGDRGMVPATKEAMDSLNKQITAAALEELNTRSMLADASTMGNPAKRSIASRTKALMPYNGNDATSSLRMVEGVFNNSSEEEKGWHLFHQAISDYQSSGLPTAAKMDGLAACMPFLQKMGYAIEGFDPKNPSVEAVTVIDLNNKTRMSFSEFAERCRDKDSLGKRLDERIGQAQWGYLMQQSGKTFANASVRGTMPKSSSDKKTKDAPEEAKDPDTVLHGDLSGEFGDEYNALPEKDRAKVIKAKREWDSDREAVLKKYGVSSVSELPDEAIQTLEDSWNTMIDDSGLSSKKFYSPVNSMIRQRSIKSMQAETAMKERAVTESEQFNEEWDNAYHGAGEEDSGAAFRRNYRLANERDDRDRTKSRNDEKTGEHKKVLKQRGK